MRKSQYLKPERERVTEEKASSANCRSRVLAVPVHSFETGMSCHFVHTVIFSRGFEVCDQETTSWDESVGGLYVETVNCSTCDLFALVSKDLYSGKDRVEFINSAGTLFMRAMTPVWKVLIEAVGSRESGSVDSGVSM